MVTAMDMRSSTAMDAWKRKIIAAFIRASIERPMFDPLNIFIKKHNFVATYSKQGIGNGTCYRRSYV